MENNQNGPSKGQPSDSQSAPNKHGYGQSAPDKHGRGQQGSDKSSQGSSKTNPNHHSSR